MSWKSTFALVLLAAAAGAWYFMGDAWGPQVGITPARPEPPRSAAAAALDAVTPKTITRVEVTPPAGEGLVVERAGPDAWAMPGNWFPRQAEVRELVDALGSLRTRFHPVPLGDAPDLAAFGLAPAQKPVAVTVAAGGDPLTLLFGEPDPGPGETGFTRPAYVRVNGGPEVLRLGPDVMPVVRRPADAYRRRQLFPDVERVRFAGGGDAAGPVAVPGTGTEAVTVRRSFPPVLGFDVSARAGFTLSRVGPVPEAGVLTRGGEPVVRPDRLADAWRLSAPNDDNPDPARLRAVLAAVPDLWVEEFVHPAPAEDKLGFAADGRSVTVKRAGAAPVTVRFGAVAKAGEREETISVPGGPPGSPPRTITQKVPAEFRYARVDGNPQVFTVPADKVDALFVPPADLADRRVARFDADEVAKVVVAVPGRPPVTLTRAHKADPDAKADEDRSDRWEIAAEPNPLPADEARVRDLLSRLAGLSADDPDRRTYPPKKAAALGTTVTVTAREIRAKGEPDAPARVYELNLGPPDRVKRVFPVWLAGRERVTLTNDRLGPDPFDSWVGALLFPETVSALIERPGLAYRGRKLIETGGAAVASVAVAGGFTLKNDGGWKLTAPVASAADPDKAGQLAAGLANLQATEYLTDAPTAAELKAFGLDAPKQTATVALANGRTYTLEVGAPRPGKPEVFARLDRGAVFGLPASAAEPLAAGAVGLLPLKVWATTPEKVTALQITRFGDAAKDGFTLTRDGTDWKLTGPFTAPVPFLSAQPTVTALGNLTAVRYQAMSSADPAEFGFDKPQAEVKITFTEGAAEAAVTKTVTVGGTTPDGQSRYARVAPDAAVFVVPAGFVAAAQPAPLDLPDRQLLFVDPARVEAVRVAGAKPEDAFTLTKAGGKWAAEGATFAVDAERIAGLAAAAARPRVLRLAAYGDAVKWADFGLDKPATTVTVTTGGDKPETHTVALGNTDPTGAVFARIDGKPAVAVLPAAAAEALARPRFEYADRTLLTFDPAAVAGFARTAGKDELELAPSASGVGWDVVKPAKQKADAEFVDELAAALGRLRADRVAAYGKTAEVFKEHGLDPPAAAVTVTVGERAEAKVLRVGKPVDAAKPDGDRYAAVETAAPEAIVGVLPAGLANKLLAPAVAFRDRTLAKFVDADRAVLERADRKVTFAKLGAAWRVTEPAAAAAESAELEALVADLGRLRADTWVAEKPKDLKPFGLDAPEAKWTLSDGDKTVLVLLVGKRAADGKVHATTEKGDLVGLLDAGTSGRVLAEYRQRKVWELDGSQVDQVEVAAGGGKFALRKVGAEWTDPAKPGDAIDPAAAGELVGTLGALRAERYAADAGADPKLFGLDKPEATVAAATRTGQRVAVEVGGVVGGTDGKQRYARVADPGRGDVFVLSAADTARLTRDRAAYAAKK
ncbi:MAG: hypothetical protein C0501_06455 [Isosphaera sp.]|nr:hypothetical protein [Isosphaera sp.]